MTKLRTVSKTIPFLAVMMAVVAMQAQSASPSFEVATVRPSDPNKPGHSLMMSADKFETQAQSVRSMMLFAYGLNEGSDQQVSGGPTWIATAQFDITAKEDAETVEKLHKLAPEERVAMVRVMVQQLLAERFKLKIHHESKELPVYALTVAKSGVKMTPVTPDPPATNEDGTPRKSRGSGIRGGGRGQLEGISAAPDILATVLGRQPEIGGRMVIDKTGLTGRYNFKLSWTPDAGMSETSSGAAGEPSGVSLFTALQEQLGLKLEATKSAVDTIVIDSAEMPTEN